MYSKVLYVSLFLAGARFGSASYDMYAEGQGEIPPPEMLKTTSTRRGATGTAAGTGPIGTGAPILPTFTRTTLGTGGGVHTTAGNGGGIHTTAGYGGGVHTTTGYGGGIPTGVPGQGGNGGKCTMDSCGDLSAIGWQITCAQTADAIPTQQPHPTVTGGGYVPHQSGGYGYQMRRKRTGNQGWDHNRGQNDQNSPQNGEHQPGAGSFDGRPICYKYIYDCDPNDQEVSAPEQYPCYKAGDDGPGGQTWAYGTGNWPNPSATKNHNDQPVYAATTGVVQPNPGRASTTVLPGNQYTAVAEPGDDY